MDSPQKPGAAVAVYPIIIAAGLDYIQNVILEDDAVNMIISAVNICKIPQSQ